MMIASSSTSGANSTRCGNWANTYMLIIGRKPFAGRAVGVHGPREISDRRVLGSVSAC